MLNESGLSNNQWLIIQALLADPAQPLSGKEISDRTKLWSGSLYAALINLERKDILLSKFEDGEYPRRRIYWINPNRLTEISIANNKRKPSAAGSSGFIPETEPS